MRGGGSAAKGLYSPDPAEHRRLAAIFAADDQARSADSLVQVDDDGVRRRSRPAEVVVEIRRQQSNGMPEAETTDTIGKLWAWGFLDGSPRFASDLLRDAGRRYAAAYWFRFGPVCGRTGAYSDMRGGSGGVPTTVIADYAKDVVAEERFARRDDALRAGFGGMAGKFVVDQFCVDSHGDNDPAWLVELMSGYRRHTAQIRRRLAACEAAMLVGTKDDRRRSKRLAEDARRKLDCNVREQRQLQVPHATIAALTAGLVLLSAIDHAEGLHRPRRGQKLQLGD